MKTPSPSNNLSTSPPPLKRPQYHFIGQSKEMPIKMTTKIQWNVPDHIQAPIPLKLSERKAAFEEKQNTLIRSIKNS